MSNNQHSNPRPFAKDETVVDKEEIKKRALNNLFQANNIDIDDIIDKQSNKDTVKTTQPILKPVFIPPCSVTAKEEESEEYDEKEMQEEAKILLHASLEADRLRADKSFEERRIAGTPYDINSVDDTDGIDEVEELKQWKERELRRVQIDIERLEQFDKEQAEAERRRNMSEEERLAQDQEKEREWTEKAEQEGDSFKFLQKYYHKGAFYQDPSDSLQQRNYIKPTGSDRGVHRDTLPAVLQVRDFGKKGRSKWTHLSAEDTTAHDYGWGDKKNPVNYQPVDRMGGMRGDLENPSLKRRKKQ